MLILMISPVAGGTTDFTLTRGRTDNHRNRNLANQHGNSWDVLARKKGGRQSNKFSSCPARGQQSYK